jgi:hypothetical protein
MRLLLFGSLLAKTNFQWYFNLPPKSIQSWTKRISLKVSFQWYFNLSPKSIQSWTTMEKNFIKSFYHIELEMTFIDLTNLVYQPEELVNAYFQWFMKKHQSVLHIYRKLSISKWFWKGWIGPYKRNLLGRSSKMYEPLLIGFWYKSCGYKDLKIYN